MRRKITYITLVLVFILTGANWLAVEALANGWHFGMYATNKETVSLGFGYGMAIRDDKSLWAWGSGVLGDGVERKTAVTPVKIMDSVTSTVALRERSFAITTDGSLYAWGSGILGDGIFRNWQNPALTPMKIMDSVVSITAYEASETTGIYSTFAITADGSLWAWGSARLGDGIAREMWSGNPALIPVKIMDSVASVYTDHDRAFVIQTDGSLWAWGSTQSGLLGCGTVGTWNDFRESPVKVMDSAASVWIGSTSTLVIRTDDSLWAWGWGQLGDGVNRSFDNPLVTPIKIMDDVDSVSGHMVLKTDGSLWAWGNNWNGRIGDGTKEEHLFPVRILDSVAAIVDSADSYSSYTMVIRTDGSLWAWGSNFGGQLGDGTASGYDYGDGEIVFYDDYGAMDDWDYVFIDNDRHSPIKIMDSVASVSTFSHYYPASTIAIKDDGSRWAWGSNYSGQLGDGTMERRFSPVEISDGGNWLSIATEPGESPQPPAPPEEPSGPTEEIEPIDRTDSLERRDSELNRTSLIGGVLITVGGLLIIIGFVLAVLYVQKKRKHY
jgi:alpha-tubulin suppressor-like RCC1 family protein